ncbi:NAD(P)/FAD-dependent oxidoreductase [Lentzea rhizosphaerae]|uniref:NAD(P)/FAD-dependent oxidoreductase n=1 Tax=Lentzea rhizosphaerae TaxID=2041025 RepID=A0ABV8C364_9PSEU
MREDTDVVILGAGIAGTILAAVLARGGVKVEVLDAGHHPRFAIGESTIPHTSTLFRLIAERYDVPEIKYLATFHGARANVSANHGIKRGFNFHWHEPGKRQDPELAHQLPIPSIMHTETHFLRADLDHWVMRVAEKYGAVVRQGVRVTGVDLGEDGVTVKTDGGSVRARYIVDASGFRSVLASTLDLRDKPCRFRHHSRSMFTHMEGVVPWERVAASNPGPVRGSQSTLHHIFDGGWIWVIPFNNHPRAGSNFVSVGMTVDPRKHPRRDVPAGQEFAEFIEQYPDIRDQFSAARPVRDWVATDRLQYSSSRTTGHRWALAMHAAGFLDPLFSRGLSFTMDWINAFAWRLLDALKEDDFSVERFEPVERLTRELLDYNDGLVANAFTSFGSFELWDAWVRIWALGEQLALFECNRSYALFRATRDPAVLQRLEDVAPHGSLPDIPEVRRFFAWAYARAGAVGDGSASPQVVAAELLKGMAESNFSPPEFGIVDPANRFFTATPGRIPRVLRWAAREAPEEIGRNLTQAIKLFAAIRLHPAEFSVAEEVKQVLARVPGLGRVVR